ncbi:MAG: hypothetical protein ACP5SH_28050, partial [Syntrophobacteraceae bacterium]
CGPRGKWVNNAHKVSSITVYYQNHPLYLHELKTVRFNKGKEVLVKAPDGTIRGIPVWMTDRVYCAQIRDSANPQCSCEALLRLRRLLDDFRVTSKSGSIQTF